MMIRRSTQLVPVLFLAFFAALPAPAAAQARGVEMSAAANLSVRIKAFFSGDFMPGGGLIVDYSYANGGIDTLFVVTAYHVLAPSGNGPVPPLDSIGVQFGFLPGVYRADTVGTIPSLDIALLRVAPLHEMGVPDLEVMPRGEILGNPFNLPRNSPVNFFTRRDDDSELIPVSENLSLRAAGGTWVYFNAAEVPAGASGSALFDASWRVIGIIKGETDNPLGGVAISSDLVARALSRLRPAIQLRRDPATVGPLLVGDVTAGANHTCAVHQSTSYLFCWGGGTSRLLHSVGLDTTSSMQYDPTLLKRVDAGAYATCFLTTEFEIRCRADSRRSDTAVPSGTLVGQYTLISVGDTHGCAVSVRAQRVRCWGTNANRQLNSSTASDTQNEFELPAKVSWLSVGGRHSCALTQTGTAYCWGDNSFGQTGTANRAGAVDSVVGGYRFKTISSGRTHTCGVLLSLATPRAAQPVMCWGRNQRGQVGSGDTVSTGAPVRVAGGMQFIDVAAGGEHSCGITDQGDVFCWGDNRWGQVGPRAGDVRTTPF